MSMQVTTARPEELRRRRDQSIRDKEEHHRQIAWKLNTWCKVVDISRAKAYLLIEEGRIKSFKLDGARMVLTSPQEFIDSCMCAAPEKGES
jgi:hypothetical protein